MGASGVKIPHVHSTTEFLAGILLVEESSSKVNVSYVIQKYKIQTYVTQSCIFMVYFDTVCIHDFGHGLHTIREKLQVPDSVSNSVFKQLFVIISGPFRCSHGLLLNF